MTSNLLEISTFLTDEEAAQLIRTTLKRRRPKALHRHDFFELIWVQNGRVRHHVPDGSEDLVEGSLLFVTPDHRHALQGRDDHTLVVTVAFRSDFVGGILARHPALLGRWFWAKDPTPARVQLDAKGLATLNGAALMFERSTRDALATEAFLLPFLAVLAPPDPDVPADAPVWLREACAAAHNPAVFQDGAAGFVRVTGKAHAHVSRTMQTVLGQSPTDYVNERRMDFAARQLVGTDDPLAEIAEACGIPNLSHFHKLFKARFGTTPQRYRVARQSEIVQPD